ncbi:lipopolysaccharide-induced tumor necrosis factor-alpha factor homolog isoform X1 [Choristoneura fumiferana]|uniref:lipopolysaccharide-induced tumor necrosis factor-alpha factor homolog isoform X1 n=1 Tax=Choristoneura fumiferana TaxID=7141 RepID=UPI003D15A922
MAAPHGKDAYNQETAYPPYDPMPAGPPAYGQYPHPHPPGPPPPAIHVQPAAFYQTSLGTTVIPGAVIVQQHVGPHPTRTTCRSCNQEMVTRIDRRPTMRTHLMAALLCVLGCWPCVCIPYCVDSCLNTDHYCTNCGSFVGSYSS